MVPPIIELVISRTVAEHIWDRHQIDADRLPELIHGNYDVIRNRGGRTATHLLIGHDFGGQCYVVPVRQTSNAHVWQVISAWYCD
jgi:hypothetical protein